MPREGSEGLFEKAVETGIKCAANLLELNKPPTAIFAFSDEMAMGVMQAVKSRGLRIPQDIAVIGYDDIEYDAHLNPPLTTISQNPFAIGTTSCQMLIDILNNKRIKNNHIHIPVKLIARESCGSKLNN